MGPAGARWDQHTGAISRAIVRTSYVAPTISLALDISQRAPFKAHTPTLSIVRFVPLISSPLHPLGI